MFHIHAIETRNSFLKVHKTINQFIFVRGNDKPRDLHSDFNWIGKCRTQSKGKGGIGICVNSDMTILDDNLINSQRSSVCGFYVVYMG
jgi:hypothetical protein